MRYVIDRDALFLHVPKTGGASVERALDKRFQTKGIPNRWKGLPSRHVLKETLVRHLVVTARPELTFAFVRRPVDWYVSVWRFLCDVKRRRERKGSDLPSHVARMHWHPYAPLVKLWRPDFNEWIASAWDRQPAFLTRLYELYCGPEGLETVDFVGRTETLADDLKTLFPEIESVGRRNVSVHPKPTVDPWVASLLESGERVAIERFYGERTKDFRWTNDWRKR